jgi:malate permease and related proteins
MTIGDLFSLILPVFALIGAGVALRRFHLVEGAAETSMLRLVVYVCMPCLLFDTIIGNPALRDPGNLLLPPLAGFVTTAGGFGVAYLIARWMGLEKGTGLRTFALSAGICNYSYLPLPIVGGLWGARAQGVVFVHNMGVELALWSVGLLVLSGAPSGGGWRRLVTPMLVVLVLSVAVNQAGLGRHVPGFIATVAHSLGVCAIPLGLLMTGTNLAEYLDEPARLLHRNVAIGACVVRLGILPVLMLCLARLLPCTDDLKRVLVVEAAMPAAVFPIIMARYFGGQPLTAVQVVLSTTAAGIVACPLWIRAGLAWVGVS